MQDKNDVLLSSMTTLALGGPCKRLAIAESRAEIVEVVRRCDRDHEALLVVGGGSNLVIADAGFSGTVLRIDSRGVAIEDDGDHVTMTVEAGEPWDALVARAVAAGHAGIECLSGIPGLTGATPMQNVGAYGQEVADTLTEVVAFDREANAIATYAARDCRFSYRSSMFRGSSRWVILATTFRLEKSGDSRSVRYAELARALAIEPGGRAPLGRIRETVIALRRGKGMVSDPADPESVSAGSFFTNPIVDDARVPAIEARAALAPGETMPQWPDGAGKTKLSAGYLIERAGFHKGTTRGRAGISKKHALALVNRGGTTRELLDLAREIVGGVQARFGVRLEPEPVFVGVSLTE